MAITKLLYIGVSKKGEPHAGLKQALSYIFDEKHDQKKTEGGRLVGGNAGSSVQEVYDSFVETKKLHSKEGGRQAYHVILAFPKGETDSGQVYEITEKFCRFYFKENYDYVFAVHTDKEHQHAHIIFNSVSFSGIKYRYEKGDWARDIQPLVNQLTKEYGLSSISIEAKEEEQDSETKEKTYSWNTIIREDIDHAILQSDSYEAFLQNLKEQGYSIREGYSKKREEDYLSFRTYGMQRARRSYHLGEDYSPVRIRYRILHKEEIERLIIQATQPSFPDLKGSIHLSYSILGIPIQKRALKHILCIYKTKNRYVKPYPQAWKYKADLLNIDQYLDRFNFLHEHHITKQEELNQLEDEILKQRCEVRLERNRCYRKLDHMDALETAIDHQDKEALQGQIKMLNQAFLKQNRSLKMIKDLKAELSKTEEYDRNHVSSRKTEEETWEHNQKRTT